MQNPAVREDVGLMWWVRGRERQCALIAAVTIAFSSILFRLSAASPSTAAFFRCIYALPILGVIVLIEDRRFGRRSWRERWPGLAAGVFFAVDLLFWNKSIVDVGAGLATVLANIQVVLVPLVAWAILAEHPGRRVLAALPVSLLGVLLISGVVEHGAYGRDPARGTLFGIIAGVTYVGFLLLLRQGGADLRRPAGPLFDATAVGAILSLVAGLVIGDIRLVPTWPSAGWLALLALSSQVFGWLLIATSLPRLPAAMTSMLLTVQPVASVLLAALILAESPSPVQLVGVVFILAALLTASRPGRRIQHELVSEGDPLHAVEATQHDLRPGSRTEAGAGAPLIVSPDDA
ncbi:MAG TPA: DMT family transporter [Solirubrobacteraceae bacterium]|nr:DMT family transporter [Solirubrobacteraceae bacterium]